MSAKRNPAQDDLFGGPDEEVPPDPFVAPTPPPKPGKGPSEGDKLRDEGIERALDGDYQKLWRAEGMRRIALIHKGWRGIAEEWRFPMEHDGWKPRSDHAWGALTRKAALAGLIRATGEMLKPTDGKSHSRDTKVWERL